DCDHRHLRSFPTRRSSDLIRSSCVRAVYVASGTTGGCVSRDIAEPPWSRAVTSGGGHLGRRIQLDARRGAEIAGFFHARPTPPRSEEHTSELQSRENLVCR